MVLFPHITVRVVHLFKKRFLSSLRITHDPPNKPPTHPRLRIVPVLISNSPVWTAYKSARSGGIEVLVHTAADAAGFNP
jgi:hypothetical protein